MRPSDDGRSDHRIAAVLANTVVVTPLLWAAVAQYVSATFYASSVQEDGTLEWMTAWGFVVSAAVFAFAARAEVRRQGRLPWFSVGLALFCLLVALEEISWGQRLLGYRPPVYFLEHNFQQELNVHNLVDTSLRKLTLSVIIVGYGVALPLAGRFGPMRRLLARGGVWAPPLALVPGFVVAALAYQTYPLKFTGEIVELMLAAAFLFSALSSPALGGRADAGADVRLAAPRHLIVGAVIAILLGAGSAALSAGVRRAHPGNTAVARAETEALKRDLLALVEDADDDTATNCGLHRRVFTWVTKSGVDSLFEGDFAGLRSQGLPEERADYFLDPWNSPYWIRHRCSKSRQRVTIYSFGPNRRRDSSSRELAGDDIGAIIDVESAAEP